MSLSALHPVVDLVRREYGLNGVLTCLPGEHKNYRLTTPEGDRFVVKLVDSAVPSLDLEFERALVEFLHRASLSLAFPGVVITRAGALEASARADDGATLRVRLLEYVPGTVWCDAGPPPTGRLRNLGVALGAIDVALAGFSHPGAKRTHAWDLTAAMRESNGI